MRLDLSTRRGGSVGERGAPAYSAGESSVPAGARGEPGVEKIRHYRNADGKLLVASLGAWRASERSKAAPLANLRGGPCVVPAGITLTCGFLSW